MAALAPLLAPFVMPGKAPFSSISLSSSSRQRPLVEAEADDVVGAVPLPLLLAPAPMPFVLGPPLLCQPLGFCTVGAPFVACGCCWDAAAGLAAVAGPLPLPLLLLGAPLLPLGAFEVELGADVDALGCCGCCLSSPITICQSGQHSTMRHDGSGRVAGCQ